MVAAFWQSYALRETESNPQPLLQYQNKSKACPAPKTKPIRQLHHELKFHLGLCLVLTYHRILPGPELDYCPLPQQCAVFPLLGGIP